MNENESRDARKKQENKNTPPKRNGLGKIYYWVIGILFLVLLLLIFFIFSRSGDNVNLDSDENGNSSVSDIENVEDTETEDQTEDEESSATNEEEEPAEDITDNENEDSTNDENSEEDATDDENQTEDIEPGESTVVDDSAPHDSNHTIDYNDGSADRVEIKNQIMAATGLGSDLTEWWVGENGPGRVEATVTNPSQTEIYRVYLQYGDGNWHVTNYERLNSNPYN